MASRRACPVIHGKRVPFQLALEFPGTGIAVVWRLTSQGGVVFCLLKVGCRRRPRRCCSSHVNISHAVMNAPRLGWQTKCAFFFCVRGVHQPAVAPHNHLQSCLFGYKAACCTVDAEVCQSRGVGGGGITSHNKEHGSPN